MIERLMTFVISWQDLFRVVFIVALAMAGIDRVVGWLSKAIKEG